MGEEEPNRIFMDTWLDSPYIYGSYVTNDGDYMKVMNQLRYKGWHTDMLGLHRASQRSNFGVGEGQEAPTTIWEKREGEARGHMA